MAQLDNGFLVEFEPCDGGAGINALHAAVETASQVKTTAPVHSQKVAHRVVDGLGAADNQRLVAPEFAESREVIVDAFQQRAGVGVTEDRVVGPTGTKAAGDVCRMGVRVGFERRASDALSGATVDLSLPRHQ